jgi:gamma-D-glutamyl-L-lysine dipeptidyl-peptidase
VKKFAFCRVALSPVRAENRDVSEMISQLLFGEPIEIIEVNLKWTKIVTLFDFYEGWVDTKHLLHLSEKEIKRWLDGLSQQQALTISLTAPWGNQLIYRGSYLPELNQTKFNIGNYQFDINENGQTNFSSWQEFALSYLNTPYLWGGKSPFGIDCSGFTQQVFRFKGINIPRDAYQQEELGILIEFDDVQEGDVAFFSNDKGKITHVGIILNDKQIIHASSWVRIDHLKYDGIYTSDTSEKTHQLASIKRI